MLICYYLYQYLSTNSVKEGGRSDSVVNFPIKETISIDLAYGKGFFYNIVWMKLSTNRYIKFSRSKILPSKQKEQVVAGNLEIITPKFLSYGSSIKSGLRQGDRAVHQSSSSWPGLDLDTILTHSSVQSRPGFHNSRRTLYKYIQEIFKQSKNFTLFC